MMADPMRLMPWILDLNWTRSGSNLVSIALVPEPQSPKGTRRAASVPYKATLFQLYRGISLTNNICKGHAERSTVHVGLPRDKKGRAGEPGQTGGCLCLAD